VCLLFSLIMPWLPVPKVDRAKDEELPPRLAKLLLERQPAPPPAVVRKPEPEVAAKPQPEVTKPEPKKPPELVEHNCINLRLPTHGGLYAWEFEKGSRELKVRVEGQLIFNTATQMLHAALAGLGLTYLPEGLVQPHINQGRLKRVLQDWCPPYPGYHLYYPSRRQPSAAFALLVEALRHRN